MPRTHLWILIAVFLPLPLHAYTWCGDGLGLLDMPEPSPVRQKAIEQGEKNNAAQRLRVVQDGWRQSDRDWSKLRQIEKALAKIEAAEEEAKQARGNTARVEAARHLESARKAALTVLKVHEGPLEDYFGMKPTQAQLVSAEVYERLMVLSAENRLSAFLIGEQGELVSKARAGQEARGQGFSDFGVIPADTLTKARAQLGASYIPPVLRSRLAVCLDVIEDSKTADGRGFYGPRQYLAQLLDSLSSLKPSAK